MHKKTEDICTLAYNFQQKALKNHPEYFVSNISRFVPSITIAPRTYIVAEQEGDCLGSLYKVYYKSRGEKHLMEMDSPVLSVPFTPNGIMEAWLLGNLTDFFPKDWHAQYTNKYFLFYEDIHTKLFASNTIDFYVPERDLKEHRVEFFGGEEGLKNALSSALKDTRTGWCDAFDTYAPDYILPSITIVADRALMTYCYWNYWTGLVRCTINIVKNGDGIKVTDKSSEILVEYQVPLFF